MTKYYRHITNSVLALIALWIGVASCNSKSPYDPIELQNVQLLELKLNHKNHPELANTFFSIDHQQSVVYNAIALDYYLKVDSVAINLMFDKSHIAEIAEGENGTTFKTLKNEGKDSIWLGGNNNKFRLRIHAKGNKLYQKEYILTINRQAFDPQTLIWERLLTAGLPIQKSDYASMITQNGIGYYFQVQGSSTKLYTVPEASLATPAAWQAKSLKGFTGGMNFVTYTEDTWCASNSTGTLFQSKDGITWETMNITEGKTPIIALMGVFKPNKNDTDKTWVVLVNATQDELSVAPDSKSQYTFATIKGGKLTRHSVAPSTFPTSKFSVLNITAYNTQSIRLVGGVTMDKPSEFVWYTTNGFDWLLQTDTRITPSENKGSLVVKDKQLYYFTSSKAGYTQVDYSTNKGQIWSHGKVEVLLPNSKAFGQRMNGLQAYSFTSGSDVIYMMGGFNTITGIFETDLWKATLRSSRR